MAQKVAGPHELCPVVAAHAEKILMADIGRVEPPDVAITALEAGLNLDLIALRKVRRYSLAAAAIYLQTENAVAGNGNEARFRQTKPLITGVDDPFGDLETNVRSLMRKSAEELFAVNDAHYSYALTNYTALSEHDPQAGITDEDFIIDGGFLPSHGSWLVQASVGALACGEFTARFGAKRKARITHGFTVVETGMATKHIDEFGLMPFWDVTIARGVRAVRRGLRYALADGAGGRLFPLRKEPDDIDVPIIGPRLKCPAHQLLFGATESSLLRGLHATVNLAYDNGMFEKDFYDELQRVS